MSQTTGTTANALFIERIRKVAEAGLENKGSVWSRIEKKEPEDVNARNYFLPFEPFENESEEWASSENFDYAPAGDQTPIRMQVSYTRVSATCSFSKDVRQMDRASDTIVRIVGREVAKKTTRLRKRLNQYACSDGTGELGRVSTIATNTLTFATTGNLFGVWKFGKGQRLQFWNPGLSAQRVGGGVTVSTISAAPDKANKQITLDQVPSDLSTSSTGDVATVVGGANGVIRGIDYHLNNSGTYQTQSRSTYPSLNATVLSASSASLSASLMAQLYHTMVFKVEMAASDGSVKNDGFVWIMPPEQVHAYENLGFDQQQINVSGEPQKIDFGFTGLSYKGNPIIEEVDYAPNGVALVNFAHIGRVQLKALAPETFPGGDIFFPRNANSGNGHQDGDNVYLTAKMETFSANPKELGGRLTTLATTGLASRHVA